MCYRGFLLDISIGNGYCVYDYVSGRVLNPEGVGKTLLLTLVAVGSCDNERVHQNSNDTSKNGP